MLVNNKTALLGCISASMALVLFFCSAWYLKLKLFWLSILGFTKYKGFLQELLHPIILAVSSLVILSRVWFKKIQLSETVKFVLLLLVTAASLSVYLSYSHAFRSGYLLVCHVVALLFVLIMRARTFADIVVLPAILIASTQLYEIVLIAGVCYKLVMQGFSIVAVTWWLEIAALLLSEATEIRHRRLFYLSLILLFISNLTLAIKHYLYIVILPRPYDILLAVLQRSSSILFFVSLEYNGYRASTVLLLTCYSLGILTLRAVKRFICTCKHIINRQIWLF